MKRDDRDRALHDYLDGRMPERERAAFEERLDTDPELAARVGFHRAVGHALRAPIEGPRPGFAGRARARFEASGARRVGWGRILRWEAAGLVGAGVLLAFMVLPSPRRTDSPAPTGSDAPAVVSKEAGAGDRERAAPPRPVDAPRAASDRKHVAIAEAEEQPARVPVEPPAAAPAEPRADDDRREADDESKSAAGVAGLSIERAASPNRGVALEQGSAPSIVERAWPLPDGAVPAGALLLIDPAASDASKAINESTRDALAELRPVPGRERVLLIGARLHPFVCDPYRVEISAESLRIVLPSPGPGRPAAPYGCAVIVPASSLPVIVENALDGGR